MAHQLCQSHECQVTTMEQVTFYYDWENINMCVYKMSLEASMILVKVALSRSEIHLIIKHPTMHSLHDNMKFLFETNKQGETFRRAAVCPRNTKQIPAIPGKRATQLNFLEIAHLNLTQRAFQQGVCINIQNKEEIGW